MSYYPGTSYKRVPLTPEDLAIVSRSARATMHHLAALEDQTNSISFMWERDWHKRNNEPPYRRSPANWERLGWDETP